MISYTRYCRNKIHDSNKGKTGDWQICRYSNSGCLLLFEMSLKVGSTVLLMDFDDYFLLCYPLWNCVIPLDTYTGSRSVMRASVHSITDSLIQHPLSLACFSIDFTCKLNFLKICLKFVPYIYILFYFLLFFYISIRLWMWKALFLFVHFWLECIAKIL